MKKMTPIFLILLSILAFFFFIDPQRKEVDSLRAQKAQNDETLNSAEELDRTMQKKKEQYGNISEDQKKLLEKILPTTVDNVRLILDINNIANNRGINIKGISVSGGPINQTKDSKDEKTADTSNALYGTITLSFSVNTDYENFKRFMNDLENSLRLVDITNFSVTAGLGKDYNYSVTLKTYWLR